MAGQAPKALATIALLKTRLDEGQDHLGLFEPLVLDALSYVGRNDVVAGDLRPIIEQRTGLVIPSETVQTVLGRLARHKFLQREGGRFFRTDVPLPDNTLDRSREAVEGQQAELATHLIKFADANGLKFASKDDALTAIATFVSDHKVLLMLEEELTGTPLERSSLDRKTTRVIARFIAEQCSASEQLTPALGALTQGILLEDTLLFRDVRDSGRRFDNLLVALDTSVLFGVLGLTGVAAGVAATEGLALLRDAGALTIAFRRTIDEMRKILVVYEEKLGRSGGVLALYPTALTHHVITSRMSPADIRVISSTLEQRLERLNVHVRELPEHIARFTLDEEALAKSLVSAAQPDAAAPRIRHDVDCVAAILTLRAGQAAISVESSVAIFSTTSGRVIKSVQQWFKDQGERSIPPIVHHAALTSIAWLKKPASAPNIKLHELAAVCVAIMRPARSTWARVIETLRRLRDEGAITDDETAAIVASNLTEPLLAQLDDDFEPDADSIEQAIARVMHEYRKKASAEADHAIGKAQEQSAAVRNAAEEAIRAAKAEASMAQDAAAQALVTRDVALEAIDTRIRQRARRAGQFVFRALFVIVALAAVLSIPGTADVVGKAFAWLARVIVGTAALVGLVITTRGGSLRELKRALEDRLYDWMKSRWLSPPAADDSPEITTLQLSSTPNATRSNSDREGDDPKRGT